MLDGVLYEYDDDDQMESSMEALYTFFGIDDFTPATEALADIKTKFKKIAEKIRNFVRKCIEWIKTKFYTLLKIDIIKIDKTLWKNSTTLLKELDRIKVPSLNQLEANIKSEQNNPESINDRNSKRVTDTLVELKTQLYVIKNSDRYAAVFNSNNISNPENMIVVRAAPLASEKSKLTKILTDLKNTAYVLDNLLINAESRDELIAAKQLNIGTTIAMLIVISKIKIITKIYTLGHVGKKSKDK